MNSRAPSSNYKPSTPPRCSTSHGSVAVDVIMGVLWGAVGVGGMADGDGGLGVVGLLAGVGFLASASAGASWGSKCKKQHEEHGRWLSDRENRIEERAANRRRARVLREQARRLKASMERDDKAERPRSPYREAPKAPAPASTSTPPPTPAPAPTSTPPPTPTPAPAPTHTRSWPSGDWSEFWREVNR